MANWVFLNDRFTEEKNASLHFRDLAFQRGYGIFDFFRLVGNEPLFLDDHLSRFYASAQAMHLPVPLQRQELITAIFQLIKRNNLPGTGIRISLTGGYADDGFRIGIPNLVLSQHSFSPPTGEQRAAGIRLLSHPYQRQLPQVKTIDYLMAVWLQPMLKEKGAGEILYHNDGSITECPRSNFFLVTDDNRIVTPSVEILPGITRRKVIELARWHYRVEEKEIHLDEIKTAREAFLTSTTKQVLRVSGIDETVFVEDKVSRHLFGLFQKSYPA